MRVVIEKPAVVITPTVGTDYVKDAIKSVQKQTYGNVKHLLVADGIEATRKLNNILDSVDCKNIQVVSLPTNTGAGGYNGQRIYAAFPHLVDEDYILFLDEDNWFEPNHVESLVNLIEKRNHHWAYSLRSIYTKEKQFVDEDNCESLGKWPIFFTLDKPEKHYIIDTSAYCYTKDFIQKSCHLWHNGVWGEDRRYLYNVTQVYKSTNFDTTGLHTLCYRLDDRIEQKYGSVDFFKDGNAVVKKHYGDYPWLKTSS